MAPIGSWFAKLALGDVEEGIRALLPRMPSSSRSERGKLTIDHVIEEDDDVTIAAITVAELMVGVELADEDRRQRRQDIVDGQLSAMPIEPYGHSTVRAHARLLAHVRCAGKPRGAHDLIIAATAVATGRSVPTSDTAADWTDLPEVTAVAVA